MRTAAALLAVLTFATVAHADELPPLVLVPGTADLAYVAPMPYARPRRPAASTAEIAAGGTLLGATMVMGLTAVGYALSGAANNLCGFDNGGSYCDASYKRAGTYYNTARNLGIAAAATAAAGIPLLAIGVVTGKHKDMRFSAAPIVSSTGGGMSTSFSMRF